MSAFQYITKLDTLHKDLIHDVSFDYYGQTLATCSSDQTIKIWQLNKDNEWKLQQEITPQDHTHKSAIQMISWASPIFGCIFASCSKDKKINIFALSEQNVSAYPMPYNFGARKQKFMFKRVFWQLYDVVSIAFAPPQLGLKLSIVCNDGKIYMLSCRDITNQPQWTQECCIDIASSMLKSATAPDSLSSLSKTLKFSKLASPIIASQSTDVQHQHQHHRHNPNSFPHLTHRAKSYEYGVASASTSSLSMSSAPNNVNDAKNIKPFGISWNAAKWELPAFAVGTNKSRVLIYKYFDKSLSVASSSNESNDSQLEHKSNQAEQRPCMRLFDAKDTKRATTNVESVRKNIDWHCVQVLQIGKNEHGKYFDVRGISWSSHLGRKYHLIAIGCSDGYVRIIKLLRTQRVIDPNAPVVSHKSISLEWSIIFQSAIHNESVWKCKWNITGNLLLSAGDDAKIYLWKRSRLNIDPKYLPICISNGKSNLQQKKSNVSVSQSQ
mmetsp:Transcript_56160/g.93594  ORF Transcript_56160/g.93594 Transcript_56160/m.93594 type:complete len:495 (+) Transcript_56160:23-1507(+)